MTKSTIFLIFILCIALVMRLINIDKFGIGGDEKYSLTVMHGMSYEGATQKEEIFKPIFNQKKLWESLTFKDYDEAIIRTDNGNSASYYVVLNVWKSVFGISEFSLRFLNVLFDLGSIILIFLLALLMFKNYKIGLIASFFVAFDPFLIGYSHQIRNYPMGVFVSLASIYFFFLILENVKNNKNWKLYFAYGFFVLLGIFSHYYVAFFVLCHFLILVIFHLRDWTIVVRFGIVYSVIACLLILWFTIGSGRETIATLKYKDEVYKAMTLNPSKPAAFNNWLTVPTVANLKAKIVPILADSFLITSQLYENLNGNKNGLLALLIGLLLAICLVQLKHNLLPFKELFTLGAILIILMLGFVLYNKNFLSFSYLSVVVAFIGFVSYQLFQKHWKVSIKLGLFIAFSLIIPMILSVLGAVKAGHTANLYNKYFSFALPIYSLILAWFCFQLFHEKHWINLLFLAVIGIYSMVQLGAIIPKIWQDNYSKYTTFSGNRAFNPYTLLAQKIETNYQKGDIVYFPSYTTTAFETVDSTATVNYSVVDAQLTSLYLPKNADINMAIDKKEKDLCYLLKKNGQKLILFNFEGAKYRY